MLLFGISTKIAYAVYDICSKNQDLVCRIIFFTFYHKICCVHLKDLSQVGEMVVLRAFTSSFDRELCYSMGSHRREYRLGDICIQNIRLWKYIVGYTVENLVLRRSVSGAVKHDFRTYIGQYTSQNENFEYGYPLSNALLTFFLQKDSENVLSCACLQWLPAA